MSNYLHHVIKNLSVKSGQLREDNLVALEAELSTMSNQQISDNLCAIITNIHNIKNKFAKSFIPLHLVSMLELITVKNKILPNILNLLIKHTLEALINETDYQAYINEQQGWYHAIAHMADLLAEIIKLPQTTFEQVQNIISTIISKTCTIEHHLVGFEMDRLSRVVTNAFIADKITIDIYVKLLNDNKNNVWNADENWQQSLTQTPQANLKYINFKSFITANHLQISLNNELLPTEASQTISTLAQVLRQYDLGFYQSFN